MGFSELFWRDVCRVTKCYYAQPLFHLFAGKMSTTDSFLKTEISWEDDYRDRVNPRLITELMHRCVPAVQACNWQVIAVEEGYAETLLPLNQATTNQHGTHQAALISLSADYTGGMAIVSLLRGVPMAGIHKCSTKEAASLWLAAMNVKYKSPSTGDLIGRCRINDINRDKILSRYSQGKRVLVTLPVIFESNGEIVAEAEMTYFCQPAIQLLEPGKKTSTLFNQKIKASARMIAGVRAKAYFTENGRNYRVDSAHTEIAAGPQGALLAEKLNRALPQLVEMVQARTQHGEELIRAIPGLQQVVNMGAGLDMRPFQLQSAYPNLTHFDLDLPEMLHERDRVAALIPNSSNVNRISIPADFLNDQVDELLLKNGFDPTLPTAIIFEGCSMYFSPEINRRMLTAMGNLLRHPDSRLWVDFVSESVFNGQTQIPEVLEFLARMDDLGEAFVFGCDDSARLSADCGMQLVESLSVREFYNRKGKPSQDPVLDQYSFSIFKQADDQ